LQFFDWCWVLVGGFVIYATAVLVQLLIKLMKQVPQLQPRWGPGQKM
jgi:hypothetical protein